MDPLNDLVKGTNFPWLMSNVIDKETNRPLAEGKVSEIIEWAGCRIGFVSTAITSLSFYICFIVYDNNFLSERINFWNKKGCKRLQLLSPPRFDEKQNNGRSCKRITLIHPVGYQALNWRHPTVDTIVDSGYKDHNISIISIFHKLVLILHSKLIF